MATRRMVSLVCDGCGTEDDPGIDTAPEIVVVAHELTTDGQTVQVDACGDCWRPIEALALAGRAPASGRGVNGRRRQ